ncbi:hypothetical protein UFOVP266_51 [uncultured Caudovirales phage]|uniref:Uncharacterized protein n=1 Tax=uncultured Caudovirales phage TaxID=2100421 RepID=A0A6J5LLX2_9CAUD|nr:hypothetical protein UFOVP266_51 [uncultured Caudovirales phage]
MSVLIDGSAGVTTNVGAVYNGLQTTTAQASTSGTSIDFTGIPLWVKRITVMMDGVSTNGTSLVIIQLGSGSFTATGYLGSAASITATPGVNNYSTGFTVDNATNAAAVRYIIGIFTLITGNTWVGAGNGGRSDASPSTSNFCGRITLAGTLDRVRITTVGGTDTFDAGTINLIYE